MVRKLMPVWAPLLFLAALELLLTAANLLVPWDAFVYRLGQRNTQFVYNRELGKPTQYLRDPDVFWRFRPGWFREGFYINEDNFRGEKVSRNKPDNTIRIICLGNSCTFGALIDNEENTYALQLRKKLQETHPQVNFEVINAGVNGYTTHQILALWRTQFKDFQPDIITVYAASNDYVFAPRSSDKELRLPPLACSITNTLLNFRVFRSLDAITKKIAEELAGGALFTPYDETVGIRKRVSPDEYQQNLSTLVEEARTQGVKVVFITTPSWHEFPLCLAPRPRIIQEKDRARVLWLPAERVDAEWKQRVDRSGEYEAALRSTLESLRETPEMPALYWKAAYCYQQLDDTLNAAIYFAKSDSLDEDHHNLRHYNEIMREVAHTRNIPLADCEMTFNDRNTVDLFVYDGIHPNVQGHALIADVTFEEVNRLVLEMLPSEAIAVEK